MNVSFCCPACERAATAPLDASQSAITCAHCHAQLSVPGGAVANGGVSRCVICPSRELYVQKDFPQRLGVAIVVTGFALSCITWYFAWVISTFAILFVTAFIDMLLYWLMPDHLVCYHCGAQYRGLESLDNHAGFNLETHERDRQLKARTAAASRRPDAGV